MNRRSAIVGFAAVIVLMSAGAAQSLSGSNTVFSDDIVDGQVKNVDIKTGTIGNSKLKTNTITGSKIADGAIASAEVLDNSINIETDTTLARGSTTLDFPNLIGGTCTATENIQTGAFTFRGNDVIAATADPDDWPTGLTFYTVNDSAGGLPGSSSFGVVACNVTGGAIDAPPTEFDWAQIPW